MFKKASPFFIHVITPLHAGSGEDPGIVDLPIQRERHTSFPTIEASSLKGAIREVFENKIEKKEHISLVFGPESGDTHAGALGFTNARLLLFPVKSMKGIFAWITCPLVLQRFIEDLKLDSNNNVFDEIIKCDPVKLEKTVSNYGKLCISNDGKKFIIILEEYTFEVQKNPQTKKWAEWLSDKLEIEDIKNKLVILPDDDFKDFVNLSTEVITRIKINSSTGTVKDNALFTEEYLPAETVLYSLALTTGLFGKNSNGFIEKYKKKDKIIEPDIIMNFFSTECPGTIQIGGNATIGKGIVSIKKKLLESTGEENGQ